MTGNIKTGLSSGSSGAVHKAYYENNDTVHYYLHWNFELCADYSDGPLSLVFDDP